MFELAKWYMDCTTPRGDLCIAYWGRLRIGPVGLSYASVLEMAGEGPAVERHAIGGCGEPLVRGDAVGIAWEKLRLRARWEAEADPIAGTLLDGAEGRVAWRCLAPRAEVELISGGGEAGGERRYVGEGYVEKLEMTALPWRLPIRVLRWGRAIAGRWCAVWIEWEGPRPRRDLWVNGEHADGAQIGDRALGGVVRGERVRIELGGSRVIREGPIGSTALAGVLAAPGVRSVVPGSILEMRESKWVSRATVAAGSGDAHGGWAIHERVEFGGVT